MGAAAGGDGDGNNNANNKDGTLEGRWAAGAVRNTGVEASTAPVLTFLASLAGLHEICILLTVQMLLQLFKQLASKLAN